MNSVIKARDKLFFVNPQDDENLSEEILNEGVSSCNNKMYTNGTCNQDNNPFQSNKLKKEKEATAFTFSKKDILRCSKMRSVPSGSRFTYKKQKKENSWNSATFRSPEIAGYHKYQTCPKKATLNSSFTMGFSLKRKPKLIDRLSLKNDIRVLLQQSMEMRSKKDSPQKFIAREDLFRSSKDIGDDEVPEETPKFGGEIGGFSSF